MGRAHRASPRPGQRVGAPRQAETVRASATACRCFLRWRTITSAIA